MSRSQFLNISGTVIFTLLVASEAFAQGQVSGIAGDVKDTSGAVLPGVTVEVASSALIEKTRTVVTDDKGQYKVIDLVTGTYSVTFSLTGFKTVKREGVQLTAAFTATVNVEMQVGTFEESINVSGASPMVDTHNDVQQKPITSQMISDLPSGRLQQAYAAMVPELTIAPNLQDVGGTKGETTSGLQIHNSRAAEMADLVDGLRFNSMMGPGGGGSGLKINMGAVQEINLGLSGNSAEYEMGGVQYNVIPKDGGNMFSGSFFANGANSSFQSNNIDDALRARGLKDVGRLVKLWDVNPVLGGPIMKDKLWFFVGYRNWGNTNGVAGTYYNLTPTSFVYTPDYSHQGYDDTTNRSATARLTWQASPKNKVNTFFDNETRCTCHVGISTQSTSSIVSPEAAGYRTYNPDFQGQGTWTMPATSRLLFEAGGSATIFAPYTTVPEPGVTPDIMSLLEASTGLLYRAAAMYRYHTLNHTFNFRGSASYITGSHAFKFGFQTQSGTRWEDYAVNSNIDLRLLNGQANQITEYATPFNTTDELNLNLGLFAQDQWTLKRLTLNVGVRFDYLRSSVPPQTNPATEFVPARSYGTQDVLHWKDIDPRLGVAYDLFGDGKTALKASLNRYVAGETTAFAHALNPMAAAVVSVTRTWTDPSGTFNPSLDCDLTNPQANGGCGRISNLSFGSPLTNVMYDPAVLGGWGVRNYNWDTSLGVQHELKPGFSLNVAYDRKSYGNPIANGALNVFGIAGPVQNVLTTPADYSPYCVTAPVDSRLPNGGGYQTCGLYDVTPAKFGQVQQHVTSQKYSEVFDGLDTSFSARVNNGPQLSGGVSTGRVHLNTCTVVNSAADLRFCNINQPLQTQVKFNWVYALPWQLQFSGVFQNLPGPQRLASATFTNAQVAPSLGRNLAAGPNGSVTVQLFAPETQFEPRWNQLDLRFARAVKTARMRIQPQFDIYNVFNSNAVLVMNTTYGPSWLTPTVVLPGRLLKLGVQVDF
jgi:hypothetical protein